MFERLGIRLRLRGAWEAVDSGFALLRAHGRPVYALWLAAYAPVMAALFAVFWNRAWIALLLMWWLKPLFDRFVLHALAKATFGGAPTLRAALRDLRGMFRRGAVAGLLWRRLSLNRAFTLPVWQLEGQDGAGYRRRAPLLLRRAHGPSELFTATSFLLVICFSLALGMGVIYLAPAGLWERVGERVFDDGGKPGPGVYLIPAIATAVLEPFYVAGGFGLYLNRRVQLEAWDLDLAFRRMAQRLKAGLGRSVAMIFLALALAGSAQLRAQAPAKNPRAELREVLKAPEFQTWTQERSWRWKGAKTAEDARKPFTLPEGFFRILGLVLKWLIIIAAAAAILWFLWRFVLQRRGGWAPEDADAAPPGDLFGLDIRPGSLPKDVAGAALALWRNGERRACLSLLYRGALARLVHERGLEVPPGATEGDCLRAAAPALGADAGGYFRGLTSDWQALAYAHREPSDGERLCAEWRRHFGGGRG